jgi:DNA repair protein RadD
MNLPSESLRSDEGDGTSLTLFPLDSNPHPVPAAAPGWLDVLPPQAECLREYQTSMVSEVAAALARFRRILLQAPTGAGKTTIFAIITAAAMLAGLRVLILATRTRLVRQIHERLDDFDVAHGVIAAAMPGFTRWSSPVQIASVDTLYRRSIAANKMPLPLANLVIFDEAHLALGASRQALLDSFPNAVILGVTATPAKTSGASLRDQFDTLIMGPSVTDLIEAKFLCKPRIFAKPVMTTSELKKIRTDSKTNDFATGELSAMMSRPKLVGDVVTNWLRIANGKRTLVFACDKGHGAELVKTFLQAGVPAEQLTDGDDEPTREEAIARLEAGTTTVLVNCFLLSYGIDIPKVDCVVLARPTRSIVLYLQAVGRGMRPAEGKEHMILIDHGRVVESLGLPTYDREWSLDDTVNVNQQAKLVTERMSTEERPITCGEEQCKRMWVRSEEGSNCPECGWTPTPKRKAVLTSDADLTETSAELDPQTANMERFYREAVSWYVLRWPDRWSAKPNSGRYWAWVKTREKFKRPEDERMPSRYWNLEPATCGPETAGWLKSEIIRYAKGQQKRNASTRPNRATLDEAWSRSQGERTEVPF